jgi:hypothetical protein
LKSTGIITSATKVAAISSMPPTVNGRAPKRSDSDPASGPATRNPAVIGSM